MRLVSSAARPGGAAQASGSSQQGTRAAAQGLSGLKRGRGPTEAACALVAGVVPLPAAAPTPDQLMEELRRKKQQLSGGRLRGPGARGGMMGSLVAQLKARGEL